MKERPILFSTEMVKAILEGRKTQTRRVIKPQPNDIRESPFVKSGIEDTHGYEIKWKYAIGDRLYVRETYVLEYCNLEFCEPEIPTDRPHFHHPGGTNEFDEEYYEFPHYRATDPTPELMYEDRDEPTCKWRPSIFMPRWASRILLEVVSVRVERVQDISFEDCLSEGCSDKYEHYDANCKHEVNGECCQGWHYGQKWNFYYLWNSINAKRGYGWDVNPWVWVIEFKRVLDTFVKVATISQARQAAEMEEENYG